MFDRSFAPLVEAARAGDGAALGGLLEGFRAYLALFADRRLALDLKQKCGASDLVQQTFLDAQQAFPRFVGAGPEEFRAWLERILLNNLADAGRRFRRVEKRRLSREISLDRAGAEAGPLIDRSTPSKQIAGLEQRERLRRALARLPDDYRRVIALRNLERNKFEQIAVVMGRSTEAVKKLWGRAILRLREEVREHGRP